MTSLSPTDVRVRRRVPRPRTGAPHPAARPQRLLAHAAYRALLVGDSTLVDIRPMRERLGEGEVLLSLHPVHLDARELDDWVADALARRPEATYAARLVVLSQDGVDSVPVVESLRRQGIREAADVIGGFDAWRRSGLPISPWPEPGL